MEVGSSNLPRSTKDLARSLGLVWGNTFTEPGDVARATIMHFDLPEAAKGVAL